VPYCQKCTPTDCFFGEFAHWDVLDCRKFLIFTGSCLTRSKFSILLKMKSVLYNNDVDKALKLTWMCYELWIWRDIQLSISAHAEADFPFSTRKSEKSKRNKYNTVLPWYVGHRFKIGFYSLFRVSPPWIF